MGAFFGEAATRTGYFLLGSSGAASLGERTLSDPFPRGVGANATTGSTPRIKVGR